MLVLCVGMYRACSTWQYGVVGALLERHRGGRRLGFVEGIFLAEKLDAERWADDWAVLKAHDAHERFEQLLASGRAIGFYAHRDLRDVVASYMHKTGTSFEALVERGFVELCLQNDRSWRAQPGVLVQRYDDLIADPAGGVRQVAAHLGIALDPGEAEAVAASLSKEANRRQVEAMAARLVEAGETLSAADQSRFDPVSLLHWNHIRPTEAGGGAEDHRLRRLVDQVAGPWLAAHGYPGAEPPAAADPPILRTSFAPGAVDVRLDRLFRGEVATAVDFDAAHPRAANPTYYLHQRGWRTVNVGTTAAPRGRFGVERPGDLNLACDPAADPARALVDLLASRRVDPPRLVALSPAADHAAALGAVRALGWRPEVVVVDPPRAGGDPSGWRAGLAAAGYLLVPGLAGPEIHLRGDLADRVPTLARPLGPDDRYREADWGPEFAALEDRADQAPAAPAEPAPDLLAAWQGERDMFQAERDAWQRERDAWQRERDQVQRERDAWDRERDDVRRAGDDLRDRLDRALLAAAPPSAGRPGAWPAVRRRLGPALRPIRSFFRGLAPAPVAARPGRHRVDGPHRP